MLKIVSTAKDFDKTLLDFENVGRGGHMDCKSNIVSIANKEQEKWVFPIGEEKQKNKKQKKKNKKKTNNKHLSGEGTLHSLLQNPLTNKVKVRFEPGSWSDGLVATKARSRAGSWNADGGDEIQRM